jgi:hypothetical protein
VRLRARGRSVRWVMIVLAAAAAVVLAGVGMAMAASGPKKSRRELVELLGVLRERQTRADRSPALIDHLRSLLPNLEDPGPERLDRSLVRISGRTPWGSEIVLAAFTTVGYSRPSSVPEMLGALVNGEIGARAPASWIRRFGDVAYFELRRGAVRIVLVVPDGVARIAYHVRCGPTVLADVHDNTTALVIRPVPADPGLIANGSTMTWYGPTGLIVKRVPSPLSVVKGASRFRVPCTRQP